MEQLLEEFDPLSIKPTSTTTTRKTNDNNTSFTIESPTSRIKNLQINQNQNQNQRTRTAVSSNSIFSTPVQQSSSTHHQNSNRSNNSNSKRILPNKEDLTLNDSDPLGFLYQSSSNKINSQNSTQSQLNAPQSSSSSGGGGGGGPLISNEIKTDDILLEAQRRSRLRQEALAKHLAHEPFTRNSSPSQSPPPISSQSSNLNAINNNNNKNPLISLFDLDDGSNRNDHSLRPSLLSPDHHQKPNNQISPISPSSNNSSNSQTIKIPTEIFQNQLNKKQKKQQHPSRTNSSNSIMSSSSIVQSPSNSSHHPSSYSNNPPTTTKVDHQKLRAALEDETSFGSFVDQKNQIDDRADENDQQGSFTDFFSSSKEFENFKGREKQKAQQIRKPPSSGSQVLPSAQKSCTSDDRGFRSLTPSMFDGPEGRPSPIQLNGIEDLVRTIMDDELAEAIRLHLPTRLKISSNWELSYSLDQHGTSLSTLYQKVQNHSSSFTSSSSKMNNGRKNSSGFGHASDSAGGGYILVVQDSNQNRFGAFVNEPFRVSKEYYGSGECFLWKSIKFGPDDFRIGVTVKAFLWTGLNDYMVLSDNELLTVGGGDGKFGLWIDSNLDKGSSSVCPAFNNEILSSSSSSKQSKKTSTKASKSTTTNFSNGSNGNFKLSKEEEEEEEDGSFEILGIECWKITS